MSPLPQTGTAAQNTQTDWFFHTQLVGWGLRGDPVLWDQMRAHFAKTAIPANERLFQTELHAAFETLTGHPLKSAPGKFGVQTLRRKQGGMSNGMVSTGTWRTQLIPILIARHRQWHSAEIPPEKPVNRTNFHSYFDPATQTGPAD